MVGSFEYFNDPVGYGYLLSGGLYTTIDVPGSTSTYAFGINNSGQVVGIYDCGGGVECGYLLTGGTYSAIDVPGSSYTQASGINNGGDVVGTYGCCGTRGTEYGFLATPEPGTLGSTISALCLLAAWHWRRRRGAPVS